MILNVNTADPEDVELSNLMLLALLTAERHAKVISDSRRPRRKIARRAKPTKEPVWPTPEEGAVIQDALADDDQTRKISKNSRWLRLPRPRRYNCHPAQRRQRAYYRHHSARPGRGHRRCPYRCT
jgi:hypothetical protein